MSTPASRAEEVAARLGLATHGPNPLRSASLLEWVEEWCRDAERSGESVLSVTHFSHRPTERRTRVHVWPHPCVVVEVRTPGGEERSLYVQADRPSVRSLTLLTSATGGPLAEAHARVGVVRELHDATEAARARVLDPFVDALRSRSRLVAGPEHRALVRALEFKPGSEVSYRAATALVRELDGGTPLAWALRRVGA